MIEKSKIKNQKSKILTIYRKVKCHMSRQRRGSPGAANVKCQRGFTLLEVIIVVGLVAMLSVGALAVLDPVGQFQKANDARRKSDLSTIQKSIEQYYGDIGKYPPSSGDHKIIGLGGNVINWGSAWSPYLNILPKDPSSSKKYGYYSTPDGQAYYLYASLDKSTDPSACNKGNPCVSLVGNGFSYTACGINEDKICNYGVTSPNVTP